MTGAGPPMRTELVGRERELAALVEHLDSALAAHPRVVLCRGGAGDRQDPDGAGADRARDDTGRPVAWGPAAESSGAPPYRPWRQVLRAVSTSVEWNAIARGQLATWDCATPDRGWLPRPVPLCDSERVGFRDSTDEAINEAVQRRPAGPVGGAVAAYHGYRQRGVAPARHLGLPSPYLTLIFTIDEPLEIAQHVDPRRPAGVYDTVAGGLHTSPVVLTHDGAQSGIQLLVNPLSARALFGLPAGELAGYDGDAAEVLGQVCGEVHDRLRDAPSWEHRFAVLDHVLGQVLKRRMDGGAAAPTAVENAWRLLLDSGGRMPVSALASSVGYSDRHLAGMFRTELGLTPKAAARVIRFDRARRALQRVAMTGPVRIGDVAACHGYYDQSHLVRDFVDFTGRAPSTWLAEEFGNVQACQPHQGAGLPL
ncbi:MAG TPA: helix-turn-helix domain-containing protein [Pseudonocardiaceae bacterium]